jgi:hypothetical protein
MEGRRGGGIVVVGSKEESRDVAWLTHATANSDVGNPVRKWQDREIDGILFLDKLRNHHSVVCSVVILSILCYLSYIQMCCGIGVVK